MNKKYSKGPQGADFFHAKHGEPTLRHMFLLTTSDLILIADALDIIDPLDEEGDEDGAKSDQAATLAALFRNKIPEEGS